MSGGQSSTSSTSTTASNGGGGHASDGSNLASRPGMNSSPPIGQLPNPTRAWAALTQLKAKESAATNAARVAAAREAATMLNLPHLRIVPTVRLEYLSDIPIRGFEVDKIVNYMHIAARNPQWAGSRYSATSLQRIAALHSQPLSQADPFPLRSRLRFKQKRRPGLSSSSAAAAAGHAAQRMRRADGTVAASFRGGGGAASTAAAAAAAGGGGGGGGGALTAESHDDCIADVGDPAAADEQQVYYRGDRDDACYDDDQSPSNWPAPMFSGWSESSSIELSSNLSWHDSASPTCHHANANANGARDDDNHHSNDSSASALASSASDPPATALTTAAAGVVSSSSSTASAASPSASPLPDDVALPPALAALARPGATTAFLRSNAYLLDTAAVLGDPLFQIPPARKRRRPIARCSSPSHFNQPPLSMLGYGPDFLHDLPLPTRVSLLLSAVSSMFFPVRRPLSDDENKVGIAVTTQPYFTSVERILSTIRRSSPRDEWTLYEMGVFQAAIVRHGKDFYQIHKLLPSKTTSQIVEFYYKVWKQSRNYHVWKQSASSSSNDAVASIAAARAPAAQPAASAAADTEHQRDVEMQASSASFEPIEPAQMMPSAAAPPSIAAPERPVAIRVPVDAPASSASSSSSSN